jgi:hypothetical protein
LRTDLTGFGPRPITYVPRSSAPATTGSGTRTRAARSRHRMGMRHGSWSPMHRITFGLRVPFGYIDWDIRVSPSSIVAPAAARVRHARIAHTTLDSDTTKSEMSINNVVGINYIYRIQTYYRAAVMLMEPARRAYGRGPDHSCFDPIVYFYFLQAPLTTSNKPKRRSRSGNSYIGYIRYRGETRTTHKTHNQGESIIHA